MRRGGAWSIVVTGTVLPFTCAIVLLFEVVPSVLTRFAGGEWGGDLTVLFFSVFMLREGAIWEMRSARREKDRGVVVATIRSMVILSLNFLSSRDINGKRVEQTRP